MDKGIRQIRSVTSGKGLALRIECGADKKELRSDLVLVAKPALDWRKGKSLRLTQLTIDSELKRTRGIRLFNKNIAL